MLLGFTTLTHAALLVSNTGQGTVSGSQFDLTNSRGQSFTTGPSARGYEVDSVEVDVSSSGNGNMTVELRESASNGKPGTLVCALNGPSSLGTGNQLAIADLIEAIETDRKPVSSASDAVAALEMILGAYESHITGGRVELPMANRSHPLPAWK